MATRHSIIETFPDHIDRETFGHWLSGFTDGEGSFNIGTYKNKHNITNCASRFSIGLRADDFQVLQLIQSFWFCGSLYFRPHPTKEIRKSAWQLTVFRVQDLLNVLIPHFEQFPLHAKKRNDFEIWKEATTLMASVQSRLPRNRRHARRNHYFPDVAAPWTKSEYDRFVHLKNHLRQQRKFVKNIVGEPSMPFRSLTEQGMLF